MITQVLYVEDQRITRDTISAYLSNLQVAVIECRTVEDAKKIFAKGGIDAVVTDGSLTQRGDGWKWAKELHAASVRVLVLSAQSDDKAPKDLPFISKGESLKSVQELLKAFLSTV